MAKEKTPQIECGEFTTKSIEGDDSEARLSDEKFKQYAVLRKKTVVRELEPNTTYQMLLVKKDDKGSDNANPEGQPAPANAANGQSGGKVES